MFNKLFGPKKVEGSGEPAAPEVLREALLELFPKAGEINRHLEIEPNEKFPQGFKAVWRFFTLETDSEDDSTYPFAMTYTMQVNIKPEEKAVFLKTSQSGKTARVPEGEEIYDNWYSQVRVGTLEEVQAQAEDEQARGVITYTIKKITAPLVACATSIGWDAYY